MASNSLTTTNSSFVGQLLFDTDLPCAEPIDFEKIWQSVDEETKNRFFHVTSARNKLIASVKNLPAHQGNLHLLKYCSCLRGLIKAIEKLPDNVQDKFKYYFNCSWKSPISAISQHSFFSSKSLHYEMVMLLELLAFRHRAIAIHCMQPSKDSSPKEKAEMQKEAIINLSQASGIFIFLSTFTHQSMAAANTKLAEKFGDTFLALNQLTLAESGQIALSKGLESGLSLGVAAKLCSDIFARYAQAYQLLQSVISGVCGTSTSMQKQNCIVPELECMVMMKMKFFEVMTFKLLADASVGGTDHGHAIALLKHCVLPGVDEALTHYDKVCGAHKITKRMNDNLARKGLLCFKNTIEEWKNEVILPLLKKIERDNNAVYFSRVPNRQQVATLPERKSIVKTIPFDLDASAPPVDLEINTISQSRCFVM